MYPSQKHQKKPLLVFIFFVRQKKHNRHKWSKIHYIKKYKLLKKKGEGEQYHNIPFKIKESILPGMVSKKKSVLSFIVCNHREEPYESIA